MTEGWPRKTEQPTGGQSPAGAGTSAAFRVGLSEQAPALIEAQARAGIAPWYAKFIPPSWHVENWLIALGQLRAK